jgi:hypothetical protein
VPPLHRTDAGLGHSFPLNWFFSLDRFVGALALLALPPARAAGIRVAVQKIGGREPIEKPCQVEIRVTSL